jgi:thioredoxin 1
MIIHLTENNFQEEVLQSNIPVLVDFWADWCNPCHKLTPILTELSEDVEGLAKVAKLDVDEVSSIADEYEILSIPTLIVFKNGKIDTIKIGVHSKAVLREMLGV